ncbi:MAG TPA: RteC domain-containing protein [Puia sp.]|nr:RteC domain-containing protein [Puia sp.]
MPFLFEETTNALYDKMSGDLGNIFSDHEGTLQAAMRAALIAKKYMGELRAYLSVYSFESREAEIFFFKFVKPRFYAQALYYASLYEIELNKPPGDVEIIKNYFLGEIKKINSFFEVHKDFYRYLRNGSDYLDHIYFLRENQKEALFPGQLTLERDPQFSTVCDYTLAMIEANKMLCNYFIHAIGEPQKNAEGLKPKNKLEWTGQKAGLVELLYALHASGVFNNSPMGINTVANYFSEVFNISLGNIYKTYEELRLRKKNRTAFLDSLKTNLLRKMEEDD